MDHYQCTRPEKHGGGGPGGLYDFQAAAARHCCCRLQGARLPRTAVLALDTGLGKTCVVRAVIDEVSQRTLVLAPGGLVRQLCRALSRMPWEEQRRPSSSLFVVEGAETGKELKVALAQPPAHHQVLVVNRALKIMGSEIFGYGLLVVDEAHQRQSLRPAEKLREKSPCTPCLFVSANPESNPWQLTRMVTGPVLSPRARADEFKRALFQMRKTPEMVDMLGLACPRLVVLDAQMPTFAEYDAEICIFLDRLVIVASTTCGAAKAIRIALAVGNELTRFREAAQESVRRVLRRADQNKLDAGLTALALSFVHEENHGVVATPAGGISSQMPSPCPCCGLTLDDRALLARQHHALAPTPPPPWVHRSLAAKQKSAVVRFPDKKSLERALVDYPVPPGFCCFVLTSDRSASQRAAVISRFSSRGGNSTKLAVLARALRNERASPLVLSVLSLSFFLPLVREFLTESRLLIADGTVDVGYDLHRHADGVYVPRLPHSRSDLQQVIGRVSRLAPERESQGRIDVIAHRHPGTLDDILWKHLEKGDNS